MAYLVLKKNSLHGERQSEKHYLKWIKNLNMKVKMIKQKEENVEEYLGDWGAKKYIYKHINICMYIDIFTYVGIWKVGGY